MPDPEKYRCLINTVTNKNWLLNSEQSVQRLIEELEGKSGEKIITFLLPETDTKLRLVFPPISQQNLCRMELINEFDSVFGFLSVESKFVQDLSETHQAIAQRHETQYLKPVTDPNSLFRGRIPLNYDEVRLGNTIDACIQAGREVERFHSSIYSIIEGYSD